MRGFDGCLRADDDKSMDEADEEVDWDFIDPDANDVSFTPDADVAAFATGGAPDVRSMTPLPLLGVEVVELPEKYELEVPAPAVKDALDWDADAT